MIAFAGQPRLPESWGLIAALHGNFSRSFASGSNILYRALGSALSPVVIRRYLEITSHQVAPRVFTLLGSSLDGMSLNRGGHGKVSTIHGYSSGLHFYPTQYSRWGMFEGFDVVNIVSMTCKCLFTTDIMSMTDISAGAPNHHAWRV